jgi:hypothetical protein
MLEKAGAALDRALARRSVTEANRQLKIILRLGAVAFRRHPDSWRWSFERCVSRLEESTDLKRAKDLESRGRKALEANNTTELRSVVEQMWTLFPADPEARRMGFDSGVR